MKTLEEKKEMIQNFEGFYLNNGIISYENPNFDLLEWKGNNRFERPLYISPNYNNVLGKCVQILDQSFLNKVLSAGGSNPVGDNLFNNNPLLYSLTWNNENDYFEGNLIDADDISQYTFKYNGNMNIEWTGFELNSNENNDKNAGFVANGTFYKTVTNNPSNADIEKFLFNPENCETINLVFIESQKFIRKLLNLYEQGKLKQEIPQQWFSTAKKCPDQSLVLLDNLLKFYVNVNPNYVQTYFKQNIDIDNILKLYN